MNMNDVQLNKYIESLGEDLKKINNICDKMELEVEVAKRCIDGDSGAVVAEKLLSDIELLKCDAQIGGTNQKKLVKVVNLLRKIHGVFN